MTQVYRTEEMTREKAKVGNIIRMKSQDGSVFAFSDHIITQIDDRNGFVELSRPYIFIEGKKEVLQKETYRVTFSSLKHYVLVYEGSKPANLNYDNSDEVCQETTA